MSIAISVARGVQLLPIPALTASGARRPAPAAFLPLTRALRRYGMLLLMVLILTGGLRFLLDPVLNLIAGFLGG
jgi:hypothetical protein